MYQPKGESKHISTSLDGMEDVFDYHGGANTHAAPIEQSLTEPPSQSAGRLTQEKRILRGSYSKGLLILREEVLPTAGNPSEQAYDQPKPLPTEVFLQRAGRDPYILQPNTSGSGLDNRHTGEGGNAVLLQLIGTYAEQTKTANELIRHLVEQLEEKDEYIRLLAGGQKKPNFWWRLRRWLRKRAGLRQD